MRVALINPPSPFLTKERVSYNSGIMRVATHLNKDGHDAKIFDLAGDKDYLKTINQIGKLDFDVYGFSSTSPQFPSVYNMLKVLKKSNPKARTLIGGPHASAISSLRRKGIYDTNIKTLEEFDTIFEGEGEDTTKMFEKGWVKGDLIKKIDDTLVPDRSLMDIQSYKFDLNGKLTTNIQTQRGCPNQCAFCCGRDVEMYNRVRQHSVERIINEMDELSDRYGFNSFMWYDDEVNINQGRLEELCSELSKRPYQHRGFVTSDQIVKHPESAKWLKNAGFVKLCTGVESGSDRILKLIGKRTTYDTNLKARQIIGDAGIHYESFLIIGHPSETYKDVKQTVKWIKEANPDDFDIGILTAYPGSKIYDESVKSTKFDGYNWEYKGLYFNKPDYSREESFYKGLNAKSSSFTRTDQMSEKYIHNKRDEIEMLKNV